MGAFFRAFRSKRVGMLTALGFASGLPLVMSGQTLSAWMATVGVDIKTIGLLTLVSLPYSVKFLWAPLLDRYALPILGRRRGWMAFTQLALVCTIWIESTVDPKATPSLMAVAALLVAMFSASQDIVSDAYRTDILPPEERASGTSTFVFGYRIAMLVSGMGALALSDYLPWPTVFRIVAILMLPAVVVTWWAPEPETTRTPRTISAAFTLPFADFFSRPRAIIVLGFVMLYKFGDYIASNMSVPFLIMLDFSRTEIAALSKAIGFGAMTLGILLGGGLVAKLGLRRALFLFGALSAATNSGYLALAIVGKNHVLLGAAIGVHNLCAGMAEAAFMAFLTSLCNKSFSATQFALLSSAATLAGRTLGASAGYVVDAGGWATFFGAAMFMTVPALILLSLLPSNTDPVPSA
jgi:MFS transporter, PAT family, beta-lactamase induction signal transducer AmpG